MRFSVKWPECVDQNSLTPNFSFMHSILCFLGDLSAKKSEQNPFMHLNPETGMLSTGTSRIPRPFVCEICGKCFGKMSQYKRHKEIHSDYRPYPCTEESCDKAFRTKAHLTEHMLIHSGIKVNILHALMTSKFYVPIAYRIQL